MRSTRASRSDRLTARQVSGDYPEGTAGGRGARASGRGRWLAGTFLPATASVNTRGHFPVRGLEGWRWAARWPVASGSVAAGWPGRWVPFFPYWCCSEGYWWCWDRRLVACRAPGAVVARPLRSRGRVAHRVRRRVPHLVPRRVPRRAAHRGARAAGPLSSISFRLRRTPAVQTIRFWPEGELLILAGYRRDPGRAGAMLLGRRASGWEKLWSEEQDGCSIETQLEHRA